MTTERASDFTVAHAWGIIGTRPDTNAVELLRVELDRARAAELELRTAANSANAIIGQQADEAKRLQDDNDTLRTENVALRALVKRMLPIVCTDIDEQNTIQSEASRLGVVEE